MDRTLPRCHGWDFPIDGSNLVFYPSKGRNVCHGWARIRLGGMTISCMHWQMWFRSPSIGRGGDTLLQLIQLILYLIYYGPHLSRGEQSKRWTGQETKRQFNQCTGYRERGSWLFVLSPSPPNPRFCLFFNLFQIPRTIGSWASREAVASHHTSVSIHHRGFGEASPIMDSTAW